MAWLSMFIMAFAVSLDSFGVGLTYGLRKIRIPIFSLLVISCLSGLMILLAIQIGSGLLLFLPSSVAKILGGLILIAIGAWTIYHLFVQKEKDDHGDQRQVDDRQSDASILPETDVITIEMKRLGILIQILKTPSKADIDKSGEISMAEAAVLGLALSLDAFGAGIGAALIGLPSFLTALSIAVCSFLFLYFGVLFGKTFSSIKIFQKLSFLPGVMLIILGLSKIFY